MAPRTPRADDLVRSHPNEPFTYPSSRLDEPAYAAALNLQVLGINLLGLDSCTERLNGGYAADASSACGLITPGDVVSSRLQVHGDDAIVKLVPSILFYDAAGLYLGHKDGTPLVASTTYKDTIVENATVPTGTDSILVTARLPAYARDTFRAFSYPTNLNAHVPVWIEGDVSNVYASPWAGWIRGGPTGTDNDWQIVAGNVIQMGSTAPNHCFYHTTYGSNAWLDNCTIQMETRRETVDVGGWVTGFAFYINPSGTNGARFNYSAIEYRRFSSTQVDLYYVLKRNGIGTINTFIARINLATSGNIRIGCDIQYPTLTVWTSPAGTTEGRTVHGTVTLSVDQRDSSHVYVGVTGQRGSDAGSYSLIENLTIAPIGFIETLNENVTMRQGMLSLGPKIGRFFPATYNANTLALPLDETLGGTGFATYAKGDILIASALNTLAKLPLAATGGWVLTVNQVTGLPEWRPAPVIPGPPGQDGLDGRDGDYGPPGPPGLAGQQGFAGSPGPDGADGEPSFETGPPGQQGIQGIQGVTGLTGPSGTPGMPGPDGADGDPSFETGPPGQQGIQGIQGVVGPTGFDGLQGRPGLDGSDGEPSFETGPPGQQGIAGPTGPIGPSGLSGVPGPDGADGDPSFETGPPGQQGIAGPTGPTGPSGLAGAPGPDGADGDPSFETGPPGQQGIQGIQGVTGLTGSLGPQGMPGPDGADGDPSFETGPPGQQGIQGATGAAGTNGNPGEDGRDGEPSFETGPPGQQGIQGPTGALGPSGTAGRPGDDGRDGEPSFEFGPPGLQGVVGPQGVIGPPGIDGAADEFADTWFPPPVPLSMVSAPFLVLGGTNLLRLGGITNAFPAIRNGGAVLRSRLADDSADANFQAAAIEATGLLTADAHILVGSQANPTLTLKTNSGTGVPNISFQDSTGTEQANWQYRVATDLMVLNLNGVLDALLISNSGALTIASDLVLAATNRLFLDGGNDTYLVESSANFIDLYVGGVLGFRVAKSGGAGTLSLVSGADSGRLLDTLNALTDGAGAAAGTLTNAPAAGNPTKWLLVNDAGVLRKIPSW